MILQPPDQRDPLSGRTLGEFVLREPIGEGGHGVVWRAEQRHLQREVVVKVLRARGDGLRLPQREALLGVRIDHPYAAHVYGAGVEPDGLVWIAMERVQGRDLSAWLQEGPMPLAQFVPLFERICEVVQAAHERGLVHRDLKPANVMVLERSGQLLPKLLDFGIARALDEIEAASPGTTLTDDAGRLFGTTQPLVRDWEGGRADLEQAVRLNPNDPQVQQYYAAPLVSLGRFPEALAAQRRSTELDPLRGNGWQLLGYWSLTAGEPGPGRSALERARQVNPESDALPGRIFESLLWTGKPAEALAALKNARQPCLYCVAAAEHDLGHDLAS